jgi:hypothetical protein
MEKCLKTANFKKIQNFVVFGKIQEQKNDVILGHACSSENSNLLKQWLERQEYGHQISCG